MQFEELMLEFASFITKICFLNGRTFLEGNKTNKKINHTRQTRDLCVRTSEVSENLQKSSLKPLIFFPLPPHAYSCKEPYFSITSPQAQLGASRNSLFSKWAKASSFSLSSQGRILQPANILVALHWPDSNLSTSFLLRGSQHLMQYLHPMISGLMSAK